MMFHRKRGDQLVRRNELPEVEVIKKRAFVRLASPNMFRVPMNEVLIVLTALNW